MLLKMNLKMLFVIHEMVSTLFAPGTYTMRDATESFASSASDHILRFGWRKKQCISMRKSFAN